MAVVKRGRPTIQKSSRADQREFQAHIREGLRLFGIKQRELNSDRHQWVRDHLRRNDPHFTADVAKELFRMLTHHAKVLNCTDLERKRKWERDIIDSAILCKEQGPVAALVTPAQIERFADYLTREIVGRDAVSSSLQTQGRIRSAIVAALRKDGRDLSEHCALDMRLAEYKADPKSDLEFQDRLFLAIERAWEPRTVGANVS